MNRDDEKRIAAKMAKTLAMMCVRNTGLETLHAGIVPVTHAGDYSDVRVIDADGREIAWNDVSHLDDGQMRDLTVAALDQAAFDIYARQFGQPTMASASQVRAAIKAAQDAGLGTNFTPEFLFEEWDELVDAWNVTEGGAYAQIPRLGRRTRLGPVQRDAAWQVFTFVQQRLAERNVITWAQLYARLADWLIAKNGQLPFSHVVVDEAQDLSVAQARFMLWTTPPPLSSPHPLGG